MNVTYHSVHGAIQESTHIYIQSGLSALQHKSQTLNILEIGFGTGLNALLSFLVSEKNQQEIYYTAVEPFPVTTEEKGQLNYCEKLNHRGLPAIFNRLHNAEWEKDVTISPLFTIHKTTLQAQQFNTGIFFNLVYFDAFAPASQPELWTKDIFEKMFSLMSTQSFLVTYCSKGSVRRTMQAAGFHVTKIPGPSGKREITRAIVL